MGTKDGRATALRNAAAMLEANGAAYLAVMCNEWDALTADEQAGIYDIVRAARCRRGTRGKVLRADFRRHVAAP